MTEDRKKEIKKGEDRMMRRAKMFQSLPVSDWHVIVGFEKVCRNYLWMLNKLKE